MTMLQAMGRSYRMSARFMLALPLLAAIPIVAELVQHIVEWRIGMFVSTDAAGEVGEHPMRMGFGYVKVAALFVMGFWAARFLGFGGDARRTVARDPVALRLFAWVLLFNVATMLAQDQIGTLMSFGLAGAALLLAGLAAMLLAMLLELYLAPWRAGAALGNRDMTIGASIRLMQGNLWWSFGFTLAMIVPIMVLHYALNGFAMGRGPVLAWTLLGFDTLVVGYLAILFPATAFIAAERAGRRKGVSLTAGGAAADGLAPVPA